MKLLDMWNTMKSDAKKKKMMKMLASIQVKMKKPIGGNARLNIEMTRHLNMKMKTKVNVIL
jgi:hypothetical protein